MGDGSKSPDSRPTSRLGGTRRWRHPWRSNSRGQADIGDPPPFLFTPYRDGAAEDDVVVEGLRDDDAKAGPALGLVFARDFVAVEILGEVREFRLREGAFVDSPEGVLVLGCGFG